jgi:hypothetical protein
MKWILKNKTIIQHPSAEPEKYYSKWQLRWHVWQWLKKKESQLILAIATKTCFKYWHLSDGSPVGCPTVGRLQQAPTKVGTARKPEEWVSEPYSHLAQDSWVGSSSSNSLCVTHS